MKDHVNELQGTKEGLKQAISSISEEDFNEVPFADSWTPAQVAEHVLKGVGVDVLYGHTQPTDRNPGENTAQLEGIFLNFDTKMKSPQSILPSGVPHKKAEMLHEIDAKWDKLTDAVNTLDLSLTCTDFEFPGIGYLTRLEYVVLFNVHTQRHTHQLKNIAGVLAA